MLNKLEEAKKRNINDVQEYRKKRKERISTGDPEKWNIKDCAKIIETDYLRKKYGYKAWLRIQNLLNYPTLNDKKD